MNGIQGNQQAPKPLSKKEFKGLKTIVLFTSVYCQAKHIGEKTPLSLDDLTLDALCLEQYPLCPNCQEFLHYAITRHLSCPLAPKPACKTCHIHCYRPDHREKIREIMRFSGPHLIKRGQLNLLWHWLL